MHGEPRDARLVVIELVGEVAAGLGRDVAGGKSGITADVLGTAALGRTCGEYGAEQEQRTQTSPEPALARRRRPARRLPNPGSPRRSLPSESGWSPAPPRAARAEWRGRSGPRRRRCRPESSVAHARCVAAVRSRARPDCRRVQAPRASGRRPRPPDHVRSLRADPPHPTRPGPRPPAGWPANAAATDAAFRQGRDRVLHWAWS